MANSITCGKYQSSPIQKRKSDTRLSQKNLQIQFLWSRGYSQRWSQGQTRCPRSELVSEVKHEILKRSIENKERKRQLDRTKALENHRNYLRSVYKRTNSTTTDPHKNEIEH